MNEMLEDPASDMPAAYGDELPPGTLLCHGQYTIEKYLNSGGFGVTYLTRDSLERKVVIKECFPNAMCCRSGEFVRLRSRSFVTDFEHVVELFEKEARALAQLAHSNIVGVHQIFKDNGTAYMALDYVEGFDLLHIHATRPDLLGAPDIKHLLRKLLEALIYVHENGILHRDISPDNVLLDHSGEPVLIDFGAAREDASRASRVLSRVHTVKDGYSPQEFYFAGSPQSPSSDLYALAATFYHLITGAPPTNSNTRLAAVAENSPDPYVPLLGRFADYDSFFLASIDKCLSLFAKDRLESAAMWRDEIDETRRDAARQAKASSDTQVEIRIAELVSQNRLAMAEEAQRATEVPVEKEPEPEPVEDPKLAAEREYWAILNEDPADWYEEEVTPPDPADRRPGPICRGADAHLAAFKMPAPEGWDTHLTTFSRSAPLAAKKASHPSPKGADPDAQMAVRQVIVPTRPVIKARKAPLSERPKTSLYVFSDRPAQNEKTDAARPRLSLSALIPWAGR